MCPASPQRVGEVVVKLMMVDGTSIGELRTSRGARLMDVYDQLMTALGGSMGLTYETRVVSPCEVAHDGAY